MLRPVPDDGFNRGSLDCRYDVDYELWPLLFLFPLEGPRVEWVVHIPGNRGVECYHGPESVFEVETLAHSQRFGGKYCGHDRGET